MKEEAEEYRDLEMELLIREYQKNGGDGWRLDEGIEMSKSNQRLLEDELVKYYQRDLMPDEETRNALKSTGGITWREDQGVEGRRCILRIIMKQMV